jgi:hypothetical protein
MDLTLIVLWCKIERKNMGYRPVEILNKEEIRKACTESRSVRQTLAILHVHLENIKTLFDKIIEENIDISHFNKGNLECSKCGKDYKIMTVLDFDGVGRKCGDCENCKNAEWIEDGGDIIDDYHYFTEGYKTHQMLVVGHTDL